MVCPHSGMSLTRAPRPGLALRRPAASIAKKRVTLVQENVRSRRRNPLRMTAIRTNKRLPNTHVPVVVCRSAGIWTRGQSTVLERPAAGGEPAYPAKRGTRLEATTDRAFLVSVGPPKVGVQRGLSILPGVRTGPFPRPNDGSDRLGLKSGRRASWLRRSS